MFVFFAYFSASVYYFQKRKDEIVDHKVEYRLENFSTKSSCKIIDNKYSCTVPSGYIELAQSINYNVDVPLESMEFFCPGSGGKCNFYASPQFGGTPFSASVDAGSSVKIQMYPNVLERVYTIKCTFRFSSSNDYFETPYFIESRYEGELSDFYQGTKTTIKPGVSRISMEIDPSMGPITLATISVINPHYILRNVVDANQRVNGSHIREMIIPFEANSTHIIGFDVFNSDFMHHWTWAKRYKGSINESYMFISMRPLKKFKISYLIVAKKSVSFHDAAEQWHKTFPEIYDMVEYEAGSYAPQPDMTKWAGKEDELVNTFLGRFQTGTFSGEKYTNVSYFKSVSPTFVYANYANNADFDSSCAETDSNCTLIKNNPIINLDGSRVIFNNSDTSSKVPLVPTQSVLDVTMSEYNENIDKWSYNGAHLDYSNMRIANYDLTHAEEFTPYTLIDITNGKECYNMIMTVFPIIKKLHQKSPKGIMISMTNVPPQIAQFVACSTDSVSMTNINLLFNNDNKVVVFGNRYSLGSRRTSIVDTIGQLKNDLFSACLAAGCIPSYNYWNDPSYMETNLKSTFEKYLPIYEKLYHNHSFMANGYNKFSNTPSTFYSTWCARDGSGHCFASLLMGSPGTYSVNVQDVKSCFFTAPDTSCKVTGTNTVQVGSTSPYRTVVVEYWTNYMYDPVLFPDEDPTPDTVEPSEEPPVEIPDPDPTPEISEENQPENSEENQPENSEENQPENSKENQPENSKENQPENSKDNQPENSKDNQPGKPEEPNAPSSSSTTQNVGAEGGDTETKKKKKNAIIIGVVAGGLLFLALLATTLFFVLAKKRDDSEEEEDQLDQVQVDDVEDGTVINPDMMNMQVDGNKSLQSISNYIDSVMIGDAGESIDDFNIPQE